MSQGGGPHRLARWAVAPVAALAAAGLLAGGPVLLVAVGGSPLPTRTPDLAVIADALTRPDDGRMLLWLLTMTGWGAWAVLAGSVLLEIGAQLTGRHTPRLPGMGGPQRLARLLVAAALAAVTASGISPAHAAYVEAGVDRVAVPDPGGDGLVHEVAEGDWMWHIAGRYLGDEYRYPEIAALNPGYAERYAGFPDHIRPGDRLVLPAGAADRGGRPHATGAVAGGPVAPAAPMEQDAAPPAPPSPAAAPPVAPPAAAPPADVPREADPAARSATLDPAAPVDQSASPAGLFAAGVLASVLVGALALRRAHKRAYRRHGRSVAAAGHRRAESTLLAAATVDIGRLDQALRVLATVPDPPDVGAVWIVDGDIHLVLASDPAQSPSDPFQDDGGGGRTLPADAELPDVSGVPAPLPGLVTLASTPGRHLLVDLERLGMLTLTGEPDRCGDLMRHLVAELAHNPWSELAEVTLAGLEQQQARTLASLNPERIRVAASVPDAVEQTTRRVASATGALARHGLGDAVGGRVTDTVADTWVPRLLVVNRPTSEDLMLLSTLDRAFPADHRRCAVAVVVNAAVDTPTGLATGLPGVTATITGDGALHLDFLLDWEPVPAASLPAHLVEEVAGLLRDAADPADHPLIPPAAAAMLRADTPTMPLAVIGSDRDWDTLVPRVELLGPIQVVAAGPAPVRRARLCQELLVLLAAAGGDGVTAAEISARLLPAEPPAVRTEVLTGTRRWLGEAPDGRPWLSEAGSDSRYRLHPGLPVDWHRFRQLRARAGRDGPAGIDDLRAALRLVRGAPLAGAGAPGATGGVRVAYSWLPDSPLAPEGILASVLDTAHDLAERCLRAGDLDTAYWAVQRAWLADPQRTGDHAWQDLLCITAARGEPDRLRQVLSDLLRCRETEHVDDLAPATRELIARLLGDPVAAGDPPPAGP